MGFFTFLFWSSISLVLMGFSIHYSMRYLDNIDNYFKSKTHNYKEGFNIYYRVPFSIGIIIEYAFVMLIGFNSYFKKNWWSIKTFAFLAIIIFFSSLFFRSEAELYYTLDHIREDNLKFILNTQFPYIIFNLTSIALFSCITLLLIESVKMFSWYGILRFIPYLFLASMMFSFTLNFLILSLVIIALYIAFKILSFFLFSKSEIRKNSGESILDIISEGYIEFKDDLLVWERENKQEREENHAKNKPKKDVKITIKRSKIINENRNLEGFDRVYPD